MSRSSAKRSAATTSAVEVATAISAGRRSIAPCQTRRAVSYSASAAESVRPANDGMVLSERRVMTRL
jgi:hypothetical protein